MPGLRNRSTWAPLLLKASCVRSCANGCSLGITAHLTYANTDCEPVEGVFVYPLGEKEVVVGFEAVIAGRMVGVQIKSRGKLEDCCLDWCCLGSALGLQCGPGKDWACCASFGLEMQCSNGHLILDKDLERTTFIVSTGVIGPMDIVTVIISTTLELPTLENGAIRLVYPSVLNPIITGKAAPNKNEHGGRWGDENGPTRCFGAPGKPERHPGHTHQCAHSLFTSMATTCAPYEFSFQLLVRGACLLAGLESPTHALRADADPGAQSASATYITLAEEHRFDRNLEIILHLSEPHSPLVIVERGRLSFEEYEQQIRARRDFIRYARKEVDPEKELEFVRKRFHKDIMHNPVLMLNFCPDLLTSPAELHQATREIVFLLDRSGSMSGPNIDKIKEGMVVALKSLPPGTLLNIVGFGSTVKTLFAASKLCTNDTVALACKYVQRMRGDMGGTNLLGALSWVYQQPLHRSWPRQLVILTDGTVSGVGRVLELVRRNAWAARCFGLGLGPLACRRLLQGVAKVTGGNTEFLSAEERLQPKLIKSLKKAFEPVLTDIHIDWYVPDNMEALLSPNEIPPLYPGSCLIGYCTLYDVSAFRSEKSEVNEAKGRLSRGLSRGSEGSVFGQSQDELCIPSAPAENLCSPLAPPSERGDIEEALRVISREISSEFSCAQPTGGSTGPGGEMGSPRDVRHRIQQAAYVQEQYVLTRCSVSSDRGLQLGLLGSDSARSARDTGSLPQGLERTVPHEPKGLPRWASPWLQAATSESTESGLGKLDRMSGTEDAGRRQKALARAAMSGRSFSSPQGELDMHRLRRALEKVSFDQALGGRLDESDGEPRRTPRVALSRRSIADSNSLLFPASPLDWDGFTDPEYLFSGPPAAQCRSVIHGLLAGKPVSWEVAVDLSVLTAPPGGTGAGAGADGWQEIVHQLTARSVIRDFENMAERELDPEHRLAKRYRTKAIQTSKSCNTVSMYTAFTAVDAATNQGPTGSVELRNAGVRFGTRQNSQSSSRRQRAYSVGLGRRPSSRDSEDFEDVVVSTDRDETPASPCSLTSWDSSTGGSGHPTSPSATSTPSQRSAENWSVESFFGSRFTLSRLRTGDSAPLRCLSAEAERHSDAEANDYLPLVRLQLASGAFLLTHLYSECVQIPLDRLKRASPYTSHRSSSGGGGSSSKPPDREAESAPPGCNPHPDPVTLLLNTPGLEEAPLELAYCLPQADSGRGSETDVCEGSPPTEPPDASDDRLALRDLEGTSWATAVALAWLEHRCAGFFVEWELVAAKADFWLRGQRLPEGMDLASLKGAARQLFLLLRHWDENIKLNMLCYNPNTV